MADQNNSEPVYSRGEQIANVITHGIGTLLSLAGIFFLLNAADKTSDGWKITSFLIFGISLLFMYLSSTLYHSLQGEKTKYVLRKIDHSAIYVLIAGTYTPFLLVTLRSTLGWILFGIVWLFAVAGIIYKATRKIGPRWVSAVTYIGMGWIAVVAAGKMIDLVPAKSLHYLVAGGLIYTFGTLFYIWKKLPFNHALWHLFVLGGSCCHYLAIYFLAG